MCLHIRKAGKNESNCCSSLSNFRPLQTTQASAAPTYHVLQYKYVPDILENRGPFREKHLAAAGQKVTT